MRRLAVVLLLLATVSNASAQMCLQGKDPLARCKPCSEIAAVTFAYNKVGGIACAYGCTTPCSVIPKALPEPTDRLSAQDDPLRGLDPSSFEPRAECPAADMPRLQFSYYAFETNDAQLREIAKASPPAAWYLAVLRGRAEIPPVAVEEGETIDESIVTAANIELLIAGVDDDAKHTEAGLPLEGDVSFVTNTRVHRLPDGHRVLVVDSRVLDHPTGATLATPYPRFAVELERVDGVSRKVAGEVGAEASLWRVVSWGKPERYLR